MSAYKAVAKATAFYSIAGCLIVVASAVATLLLVAVYGLMFGSADGQSDLGGMFVGIVIYTFYALMFGAIPAITASFVLSMCVMKSVVLGQSRLKRSAVGAALGWMATALFLSPILGSAGKFVDLSALRGLAMVALVGGVSGALAGALKPPTGIVRAA